MAWGRYAARVLASPYSKGFGISALTASAHSPHAVQFSFTKRGMTRTVAV